MIKFYSICFWGSIGIFIFLLSCFLCEEKYDLISNIALPFAASIFAFGQLWQQEKQMKFEDEKYRIERNDKFRDQRVTFFKNLFDIISSYNFEKEYEENQELYDYSSEHSIHSQDIAQEHIDNISKLKDLKIESILLFNPEVTEFIEKITNEYRIFANPYISTPDPSENDIHNAEAFLKDNSDKYNLFKKFKMYFYPSPESK